MPTPEQNEEALFAAALERPLGERAVFLDGACHCDAELRQRLDALLAMHDQAEALPPPPADSGRTIKLEPLDEALGRMINRYKLLEKIGEGGCGVVYVAEQTEPVRRRVALKLVKPGMDTRQVLARFEAERQALALMDHPNIAKVLDAGSTETGRPFFVMELVRGKKITEHCDAHKLATDDRLKLFMLVCQAVQHAHQKGIIHRDIKPSNVLVTSHDGVAVPKVIDFGIAKATSNQALTDKTVYTAFEQFIGTPAYMSPEQAEMSGLDIDTRSDIYSLGVLLYELLTGCTPFDAKTLMQAGLDEMRRIIREQAPPRPSTRLSEMVKTQQTTVAHARHAEPPRLLHTIRGDLDWIAMKCLEKDRARRYETANGLALDIQRHLSNEPIAARPPSKLYEFRKTVRRHKFGFAATAAIIIVLIVGVVVSSLQSVRARRAERIAAARLVETETARAAEAGQRRAAEQEREVAVTERRRTELERDEKTRQLYVSTMHLIERAWEDNNVGRVRELLERQQPEHTGGVDLRGWEWFYRWRLCHSELRLRNCDTYSVACLAFSPDGTRLIGCDWGGNLRMWSGDGSREIRTIQAHSERIDRMTMNSDGRLLATAGRDGKVKLWEIATGRLVREFPGGSGWTGVALSPDGHYLAIANDAVTLWDATEGKRLKTFPVRNGLGVLAFSPDGSCLFAGRGSSGTEMWNVSTGAKVRSFGEGLGEVSAVTFQPDGKVIVACHSDGLIRYWDAQTGREIKAFTGHSRKVNGLAFDTQAERLVSASNDATARIWDATTGRELQTLKGHTEGLTAVAVSPDGEVIATGSYDATVRLWDSASRQEPLSLSADRGALNIAYSSDNKLMAIIGSADGFASVIVSDAATGKELWSHRQPSATLPTDQNCENCQIPLRFDPESRLLALGASDGTVHVWDAQDGRLLRRFQALSDRVMSLDISPDGRTLATAGPDQRVALWDLHRGEQLGVLQGHKANVNAIGFSPDGKSLASGGGWDLGDVDNRILLWDLATRQVSRTLSGHEGAVFALVFTRDGRQIVSGGRDNTIRWWDATTARLLRTQAGHSASVVGLSIAPDGKRLASCSADETVKLWDMATFAEVQTLKPFAGMLNRVIFSPDGWRLAACARDERLPAGKKSTGRVIVWDAQLRASR